MVFKTGYAGRVIIENGFFPTGSTVYLFIPHGIPTEIFVMRAGCSRMCKVSRGQSGMTVSPP